MTAARPDTVCDSVLCQTVRESSFHSAGNWIFSEMICTTILCIYDSRSCEPSARSCWLWLAYTTRNQLYYICTSFYHVCEDSFVESFIDGVWVDVVE